MRSIIARAPAGIHTACAGKMIARHGLDLDDLAGTLTVLARAGISDIAMWLYC